MTNQLPIITADQRMAETKSITGCVLGKSGCGKTSLLWTLPETSTLFIDLEAGDLAVNGWKGDAIRPKTWQECRDLAVFICGAKKDLIEQELYSKAHYKAVCDRFGDPKEVLAKYDTVFIDSITVAARLCFGWCKENSKNKAGDVDTRAAYGLLAQEMITWITLFQRAQVKNIWFVGILDEKVDEYNQRSFDAQIEGSKIGAELPGIIDQLITMAEVVTPEHPKGFRAFVNHHYNPYKYPAKDRSGQLDLIEPPHLGKLMEKIRDNKINVSERLHYDIPTLTN